MLPYVPLSFFLSIISTSHGLNITVPLIHRDSIYSPLYNATETIEDRAQRVAKASLDRYEYLSSTLSIRPEAKLVPGFENHAFFISFSIGTPRIPQLALMDTGSTALWVKCKPCSPCKHGPKDPPIFDLAKSWSSYKVPCQKNCEKCIVFKDAHGLPPMGFHFKNGGSAVDPVMKVQSFGMFYQVTNDIFCLAIRAMSPYVPMAFFLFIISTLIFSTSHGVNITVPLIHRDSIYSPLYNATETIEDRAQRVAKASLDRYEYLSSALSIRPEATLVPGFQSYAFYMNFSIGTPPVPQLVLMDTGSALLWVKCKPCSPCKHGPKDPPIFDPVKSSTIYEVPCEEKCKSCTAWPPWAVKKCKFTQKYVDGSVSDGIYMKDRLIFQTSANGRTSETFESYFGCSNYQTDKDTDLDKHFSGVIGLGPSKPEGYLGVLALIWDLGSKFSYCVGRFSDRNYPYNSISFGANANMLGMETPMYSGVGTYHVNLLNISIGDKVLMSNIHAGEGDWRSVDKVRKGMRDNGLQKLVGLSWMKEKQRVEDVIQKERQRVARLEAIVTQLSTTVLKAADEPFPYIDQEASDDEQAQASEKDDD
ncbi:Probable aspartic protease At2g35615 [Linum perenne]